MLLLTDEDDFNALASVLLAEASRGAYTGFRRHSAVTEWSLPTPGNPVRQWPDQAAVTGRYQDGARIVTYGADGALPAGQDLLFRVRTDGQLAAVTQTSTPAPQAGDTIVSLGPALAAQPADASHSGLPGVERQ